MKQHLEAPEKTTLELSIKGKTLALMDRVGRLGKIVVFPLLYLGTRGVAPFLAPFCERQDEKLPAISQVSVKSRRKHG
jgi:hypothetical protein